MQPTPDRAVQPRVVIDLGPGGANPVKAAIITDGSYVDLTDFNPVISRWTTDTETNPAEYEVATDGWWPSNKVVVRTVFGTTPADSHQWLVIMPGQFQAALGGSTVVGTERLWRNLSIKLVRGPVPSATGSAVARDTVAPVVNSVKLSVSSGTWTAVVDAYDPAIDAQTPGSGIAAIDVTPIGGGSAGDVLFSPVTPWSGTTYDLSFDVPGVPSHDVSVSIVVTDNAGNATPADRKGDLFGLPPQGTMELAGGAPQTLNRVVTLDSSVIGAESMRTSSDGRQWTAWRPYLAKSLVALSGMPGTKTVRVQYRSIHDDLIERSDQITLGRAAVSAGGLMHSLALTSDGALWAWGQNYYAELGDGSTTEQHFPVPIATSQDWAEIAAGFGYSLALDTNGGLWEWGTNTDGVGAQHNVPTQIGSGFTVISAGAVHSLALKGDGSLWAWGSNQYGELGDGGTTDQPTPVPIDPDEHDWVAVSAGVFNSFALKADGSLWGWGTVYSADGVPMTTTERDVPTRIGTDTDWVAISDGSFHRLALKADGSLWAWGSNTSGELGDGTTVDSDTPKRVGIRPRLGRRCSRLGLQPRSQGRWQPAGVGNGSVRSARRRAGHAEEHPRAGQRPWPLGSYVRKRVDRRPGDLVRRPQSWPEGRRQHLVVGLQLLRPTGRRYDDGRPCPRTGL